MHEAFIRCLENRSGKIHTNLPWKSSWLAEVLTDEKEEGYTCQEVMGTLENKATAHKRQRMLVVKDGCMSSKKRN